MDAYEQSQTNEIEMLDEKLRKTVDEYKRVKASTQSLDLYLQKEDFSLKEKQREILDMTSDVQRLKFMQENYEREVNKVTQDINEYLFALRKYD